MRDRNPLNAVFIAVYWFIGGYVLMSFSLNPLDPLVVGALMLITGTVLYAYIESQWIKGIPVHGRFRGMLLTTPLILIFLGVFLLIIENVR